MFDPKDINIDENSYSYMLFTILCIICVTMFYILYNKTNISMTNIYNKIHDWFISWCKPIINGNSIYVTRYSYSIPRYIV
jgi:hypothetical protein